MRRRPPRSPTPRDDDYTYNDSSTSDDDYEDIDAGFDGGAAELDPGLGS